MKIRDLRQQNLGRPQVIFDALTYEPDASGNLIEKRKDAIIYLDGTNGTLYHFQRYTAKEGWVYKSHANLDVANNEEHKLIQGYINSLGAAVRAYSESQGIVAKAEARAKAKKVDGE